MSLHFPFIIFKMLHVKMSCLSCMKQRLSCKVKLRCGNGGGGCRLWGGVWRGEFKEFKNTALVVETKTKNRVSPMNKERYFLKSQNYVCDPFCL